MSVDTISDDRPLDPDDELLVAYLDGELDGEERSSVEQRLMDDNELRSRLRALQTGWDWLDDLPEVEPSEKLVESTLELVVADLDKPEAKPGKSWMPAAKWPIAIATACVLSASVVWAGISLTRERAYKNQLRDLEIAENLDAYAIGGNLQLMRALASNPNWDEMVASARAVGNLQVDLDTSVAKVPLREREDAIREMSVESRTQLASRWDRFKRLSEKDLQRVLQTAAEVAVQPDPDSLIKTMQTYSVWQEILPRDLREDLQTDDVIARKKAINKAIEFTKTEVSRRSGNMLPEDPHVAMEPILFVLKRLANQRMPYLDESTRKIVDGVADAMGEEMAQFAVVRSMLSRDDWRSDRFRRGPSGGIHVPPVSDDELLQIKLMLPDEVLDNQFFELTFGDPQYEALVLRAWADEAIRRKIYDQGESDESRLDRYLELEPSERERIDLLSPKDILRELSPSRRWGDGPPSPGGGGYRRSGGGPPRR
tara:strand:- start:6558 stop:8009 length:1452 start_codon:yes stop_codon:yes gene_type:complete